MIVLDCSAVLAAMLAEPGAERVNEVIEVGVISAVNAAEVVGKLIDKGYPEDDIRKQYDRLELRVADFDEGLAVATGRLRAMTDHRGLSLGDRACLALAIRENATALTADRSWRDLDVGCRIELIR